MIWFYGMICGIPHDIDDGLCMDMRILSMITLWLCQNRYWKMATEILDLPIENGDFPWLYISLPEDNWQSGNK